MCAPRGSHTGLDVGFRADHFNNHKQQTVDTSEENSRPTRRKIVKEGKMTNMTVAGDNMSESEMLHALLQKNVQRVTDLEKNVDSFFVVVISIIIFCEYHQQTFQSKDSVIITVHLLYNFHSKKIATLKIVQ